MRAAGAVVFPAAVLARRLLPPSLRLLSSSTRPGVDSPSPRFTDWPSLLPPDFTPDDLASAITAASRTDPDLSLDLFRWASVRPSFRHSSSSYLAAFSSALANRRFSFAESLVRNLLSGACPSPSLHLYNAAVRFCCGRRKHLFPVAFDLFKKMRASGDPAPKPDIVTYKNLLAAVLRRITKASGSTVCVYLQAVKSLWRQMRASGVVPDVFVLNLVIKAYAKCLEADEALRVFREMPLYNCEPNEYSFGYLVKGLFEKGWSDKGMQFFKEMRKRRLVPTGTVYMVVVASLALESRTEEAIEVTFDMVKNRRRADLLTYQALLEALCREGRSEDAFKLLEELGRLNAMDRKMYSELLDGLRWLRNPQEHSSRENSPNIKR